MSGLLLFISNTETFKPAVTYQWKRADRGGNPLKRNRKAMLALVLCAMVFLTACSALTANNSSADWAFSFVVWDDHIYQVDEEYVQEVNEEIGEVTVYSDIEGSYEGNFSNEYEKGTKYYSIIGISTEEAIAVQEENGKYRKAIREGKYARNE